MATDNALGALRRLDDVSEVADEDGGRKVVVTFKQPFAGEFQVYTILRPYLDGVWLEPPVIA
jgi:hypothetical protein